MTIDYEAWRFWIGIFQLIGTVVLGDYVGWSNREKVTRKRFETLEGRVGKVEGETKDCPVHREKTNGLEMAVTKLNGEVKNLPTQRSITELNTTLSELKGQVRGLAAAVDLMNEFLINQGGKK